ncbi:agamous-like MADS-box protein AGL12 [Impatiens glandulifera]|uniref:agamous-like MADS-box protein AGL12 n=1 Tax=Impatiens glandulifera TaxID=253017 RepID=UPI001FB0C0F8|nr:agamous-like MADS-box protein AGL12 [Impatiens glandulifera]
MARGKVQMKRIENPVHRQVTFCKRRTGLLKKAKELSILCDAEIGILIYSAHGKLYELATNGTMQGLMDKYVKTTAGAGSSETTVDGKAKEKQEIDMLKNEIDFLEKGLRYMFGVGSGTMTLDEMNTLEKNLEVWIYHVRSAKMDIMFQEIQLLKNKEGILKAANKHLQDKMDEHFWGTSNFLPVNSSNQYYPLTVDSEIYQV